MTFKYPSNIQAINNNYPPGRHADLSDLDPISCTATGNDIPFGLVVWFGPEADASTHTGHDFYPTNTRTCLLPFKDGATNTTNYDGVAYAYSQFKLGSDGLPIVAGISVHSPVMMQLASFSDTTVGLVQKGNQFYAKKNCDSVTVARNGRIHVYAETALSTNSVLGTRNEITDPASLTQCLGSLVDMADPLAATGCVALPASFKIKVVEPAPAGGCGAMVEIFN
jgi:hypothetical protein